MHFCFDDFIFIDKNKILGSGSFSKVHLVVNKNNNVTYALKEVL